MSSVSESLILSREIEGDTHLLDGVLHDVPDNLDLSVLAESQDPPDGLALHRWIPLGLEKVYPVCNRQVV